MAAKSSSCYIIDMRKFFSFITVALFVAGCSHSLNPANFKDFEGLIITEVAANDTCKMKITDGTWDHNWGYSAVKDAPAGVGTDNDGNIVVFLSEGKEGIVMETTKPVAIGTLNVENTKTILPSENSRETVNELPELSSFSLTVPVYIPE